MRTSIRLSGRSCIAAIVMASGLGIAIGNVANASVHVSVHADVPDRDCPTSKEAPGVLGFTPTKVTRNASLLAGVLCDYETAKPGINASISVFYQAPRAAFDEIKKSAAVSGAGLTAKVTPLSGIGDSAFYIYDQTHLSVEQIHVTTFTLDLYAIKGMTELHILISSADTQATGSPLKITADNKPISIPPVVAFARAFFSGKSVSTGSSTFSHDAVNYLDNETSAIQDGLHDLRGSGGTEKNTESSGGTTDTFSIDNKKNEKAASGFTLGVKYVSTASSGNIVIVAYNKAPALPTTAATENGGTISAAGSVVTLTDNTGKVVGRHDFGIDMQSRIDAVRNATLVKVTAVEAKVHCDQGALSVANSTTFTALESTSDSSDASSTTGADFTIEKAYVYDCKTGTQLEQIVTGFHGQANNDSYDGTALEPIRG